MKRSFITLLVMTSLVIHFVSPAVAGAAGASLDVSDVTIFGVKLKEATREDFRKACKAAQLVGPTTDTDLYGVTVKDYYTVTGQLEGATDLTLMFALDTGELISATYFFKPETQVSDVVEMVSAKYGPPGKKGLSAYPEDEYWPNKDADWRINVYFDRFGSKVTALEYAHNSVWTRCFQQMTEKAQAKKKVQAKAQDKAF